MPLPGLLRGTRAAANIQAPHNMEGKHMDLYRLETAWTARDRAALRRAQHAQGTPLDIAQARADGYVVPATKRHLLRIGLLLALAGTLVLLAGCSTVAMPTRGTAATADLFPK